MFPDSCNFLCLQISGRLPIFVSMIADGNNRIKVSVYSICYNQASYIRQCVESILAQKTNFDFEAIFIDDCSTDGTSEILADYASKYPDKIIHLRHDRNRYAENYDAFYNSFLPVAKGEYVACLEGDDFWCDTHKLQKQVDILDSMPDVGACVTNYHVLDDLRGHSKDIIISFQTSKIASADIYRLKIHCNTLIFRKVIMRDNVFQKEIRKKHPRDLAILAELAPYGIICLPIFGLTYRLCRSGVATSQMLDDSSTPGLSEQRLIDVLDKMEKDFPKIHNAFARRRAQLYLDLHHIYRNSDMKTNRYWICALKESPLVFAKTVLHKISMSLIHA